MKIFDKAAAALLAFILVFALAGPASAAATVNLGTAGNFAVLGASAVTNTGSTVINGNLGISPGTSVTGFPPGIVTGTQHVNDAAAAQAQTDLNTAYNGAAGLACDTDLSGQDLGGLTLTPGVYCFSSSAQLTGVLTLNGQGNPNATFIFQIGSSLTTASNSSVSLIGSAQSCNVFWKIGSSATLGTNTSFRGTMMALASITLNTGTTVEGAALAHTGAVTLDANIINMAVCASPTPTPTPSVTASPTPTASPTGSPTAGSNGNPRLPNAGAGPDNDNGTSSPWLIVLLTMPVALSSLYLIRKHRLAVRG